MELTLKIKLQDTLYKTRDLYLQYMLYAMDIIYYHFKIQFFAVVHENLLVFEINNQQATKQQGATQTEIPENCMKLCNSIIIYFIKKIKFHY